MNIIISCVTTLFLMAILLYVAFSRKYPFQFFRTRSLPHPLSVLVFALLGALSLIQFSIASTIKSEIAISIQYIMVSLCFLYITYAYLHLCKFVLRSSKENNEE